MSRTVERRVGVFARGVEGDRKDMVRIDSETMQKIGASPGSVVEVECASVTTAFAANAYPSDIGLGIIRMDKATVRDTGARIGGAVRVRLASSGP